MMSLHMGAAGSPAAASAMAAYLLESQIPDEAIRAAAYYGQTSGTEEALAAGHGTAPMLRADIAPELAKALGFKPDQVIDAESLGHILSGRRADGEALPVQLANRDVTTYGDAENADGKVRHRVAYLDLTLSAPKSLSVAWAFAETEAERNSLLQAHRTARDETLRYVEQQIIRGRLGAGGEDGHEAGRAAWITVDHFTARPTQEVTRTDPLTGEVFTELRSARVAGDPALHSHTLVPNLIVTESGRFASIDTAAFHGRIHEFGAVYQAVLGRELRLIGAEVELDPRTNMARLPAIPEHVVDEFSKRSREGEKTARLLAEREGRDWDSMAPEQRATFNKVGTHATRQNKETNIPDMQAWRAQAARIGWEHRSVLAQHGPAAPRSRVERMDHASREGLPHLAEMLGKRAVIGQGDPRLAAARGFIAAGIEGTDEIGAMMKHWAREGVQQDGRWTKLLWQEVERGKVKLTTELHRDQETELIALARKAIADRRHALRPEEVALAVGRSTISYQGEHGAAQRRAIEVLGTDGGLAVMVGAAGVGKTKAVLPPLVAAWQERGLTVWGAAQAWRQAKELEEAGIGHAHTRALQPFLEGVHAGRTKLDGNSVVVLDELGQIGTRQLLDLLRLREAHGFKLVALGDDRQAQSIEAGPVIDLLRRAIGEERIPQILSTVRQLTKDERYVAGLFRDGKAGEAIAVKREAGTAELVPGGYREAVERVADLYEERRRATRDQPGYRITISAPTNVDAREISRAVRERRRAMGEVGADQANLSVTDGRGNGHTLDLAAGDKVRLFARTRGVFTDGQDRRKSASVGDNGTVLEVVSISPEEGLRLRGESGKVAFVAWAALQDRSGSGRLLLAHGDVLTIDSSQGITSDEHINALPSGSKAAAGFKAYVAQSRHRVRSYMVGSMGAEMREAKGRRMSGLPLLTPQQEVREGWANLVRNLEQQPKKESALALLERAVHSRQEMVKVFQGALCRHEAREAAGHSATTARQTAALREVRRALPEMAEGVAGVTRQRAAAARQLASVVPSASKREQGTLAEAAVRKAARERVAGEDAGARTAAALIAAAEPADASHPYLVAKGIDAHGLYVADAGQTMMVRSEDGVTKECSIGGCLLVPLRTIDGKLRSVHAIAADGTRLSLGGAQTTGTFHLLGKLRPGEPVTIAVGYAAAATVHRADGMTVAVALDISNLLPIAVALRQRDPDRPLYIAADNDHHLPLRIPSMPNVGRETAEVAAAAVGATVLLPAEVSERTAAGKGTDWNDYETRYGRTAAKALLQAGLTEAIAPKFRETQQEALHQSMSA